MSRTGLTMTVLGLVLGASLTACGGSEDRPAPVTTPTSAPASSTTTAPAVEVPVTMAPGPPRSTTTVPLSLGPGEAALSGTVTGPEGAVNGAVVRVERLVSNRGAVADLRTDESGSWSLTSVLGGPYRVTAFKAPDLGSLEPQLFFLGSGERRSLTLALARVGENTITARVEPNPPRTGAPATFSVRLGTGRVDGDGAIVVEPTPAARLQLVSEGLAIESPVQLTDSAGRVSWLVRCLGTGSFPVALLVGNGISSGTGLSAVPFPACEEGPPAPAPSPPRASAPDPAPAPG